MLCLRKSSKIHLSNVVYHTYVSYYSRRVVEIGFISELHMKPVVKRTTLVTQGRKTIVPSQYSLCRGNVG